MYILSLTLYIYTCTINYVFHLRRENIAKYYLVDETASTVITQATYVTHSMELDFGS
jgi:hypothetical protein